MAALELPTTHVRAGYSNTNAALRRSASGRNQHAARPDNAVRRTRSCEAFTTHVEISQLRPPSEGIGVLVGAADAKPSLPVAPTTPAQPQAPSTVLPPSLPVEGMAPAATVPEPYVGPHKAPPTTHAPSQPPAPTIKPPPDPFADFRAGQGPFELTETSTYRF